MAELTNAGSERLFPTQIVSHPAVYIRLPFKQVETFILIFKIP